MQSWSDAPDSTTLPTGWVQSLLGLTEATARDHLEHAACISLGRTPAEMRATDVDGFGKGQLFEVALPSCLSGADIGSMHTHPTLPAFFSDVDVGDFIGDVRRSPNKTRIVLKTPFWCPGREQGRKRFRVDAFDRILIKRVFARKVSKGPLCFAWVKVQTIRGVV